MLDNAKYCLCNNGKQFSLKNGNPFNGITMQASYNDLWKSQKCIQGAPLLELDTEDSPQFRLHSVENTSSLKH
jgi:hypothetical protein